MKNNPEIIKHIYNSKLEIASAAKIFPLNDPSSPRLTLYTSVGSTKQLRVW